MGSMALVSAIAAAVVWAAGAWRPSRISDLGRWATIVLGALAVAVLAHDLWTVDPASRYVTRFSSASTPLAYRLAGLWGGMEGSMLTWSLVVAVCVAIARSRLPASARWIDGVGGVLVATFLAITLLWASPFTRLEVPTGRGDGLPAVLQHPAMLYHPPILYTGLALAMVPMLASLAALARNSLDAIWRTTVIRWTRAAWLVLGTGMVLGSSWAYAELGWGGFWAWDPVENAALVPWLLLTALLHALRSPHTGATWPAAALAAAAGVTTIVGVYATRSGSTGSIHAFASSPTIGRALVAVALIVAGICVWALSRSAPRRWSLRRRDGVLAVPVLLVTAAALVIAAGTFGPLVTELFGARPGAVRPDAYTTVLAPVAVLLLIAAAAGPALVASNDRRQALIRLAPGAAGGALLGTPTLVSLDAGPSFAGSLVLVVALTATGAIVADGLVAATADRTIRRVGVALSHAGVALLLAGAAGTALGSDTSIVVPIGATASGPDAMVTLHDLSVGESDRYEFVRADVTVAGSDHRFRPELRAYDDQQIPTAEASFDHRPLGDTIVVMSVLEDDLTAARITVRERPLVNLVWWGAATTAMGALVAWSATRVRGGRGARRARARTAPGAARSRSATPAPRTTAATAADATSSSRSPDRPDRTPAPQ